ncbi:porin [Trinickia symbiotica]|uniref:Porin n=1 Tax=Trinickia symbiotica TaxID=863227 RepID=A0A2T3XVH9_9BURK|nr:porin [Trinickia symbiotica]PTB20526.1 porin [Trinickia symbiotica]
MKKTLLVGALAGAFATMAHAQSSVTLYGLIDAGITYANNSGGHSLWQESNGAINSSRWGLRGAEDLGGGLKAIFTLENGFSIANGTLGQQGREFGRQAFVGLSSDQFGAVTLGRQYDDVVQYLGPLSLTGTQYGGTFFAHPFDNDNLDNTFRVNNSVHYQSANYAGFKLGAMYGFSNSTGFSNNREYSVGASYSFAGFNFAAAYMQLNSGVSSMSAASPLNSGGAVTDSPFLAQRQRTWGAGLNYTFGPATAGFVFTQTRLTGATSISSTGTIGNGTAISLQPALGVPGSMRFNNYEVNARYALTPALNLAAEYTYTDGELNGLSPKWGTLGLLADYYLSKRTDVYLQGEYQHVMNSAGTFTADLNTFKASSTSNQVAVTAGIRHRF